MPSDDRHTPSDVVKIAADYAIRGRTAVRDQVSEANRRRVEARSRVRLAHAGSRRDPVIVGPWVSEVGFEVLYWIPVLRKLAERDRLHPETTTIISRGGAEPWYSDLCANYVDLFDYFTPEELRDWHDRRLAEAGGQKHMYETAFDAEILRRAGDRLPEGARTVHPSLMYNAFRYFWSRRTPTRNILKQVRFRRLAHPGRDLALEGVLPDEYVAVKGYFSKCFPATEGNRRFLRDLIARLAERAPVVLLSTGLAIDDHEEFVHAAEGRVIDARPWMEPRTNLAVQTRLIHGARALFTTYGGFSYLGPFLDVPSVCFYSDDNFNATHLEFMRHAMKALDGERFVALDTRDMPLLDSMFGWGERVLGQAP